MKLRKNQLIMTICLLMGMMFGMTQEVKADSSSLSVKAILPENQYDKDVSYYSLLMKPGQKQEIEVQLFNSSDSETVALLTLTNATTNDNGLIDYTLVDKETDSSLLYPFTDIAKGPKEISIPAGSDVKAKISLDMPVEEFDGMILGGINIKAKSVTEQTEKKQAGGMKIENEMNYAIGVVLIENERPVKTNMQLERVSASQVMGVNTTKVTLQNPTSAVMEDLQIEAKIYKKGSDQVLYETKKDGYRMAPNSSFDFGVSLGHERYRAGDYRLKLVAMSDPKNEKDGEKQTWEFDELFTIKRDEATKLNEKAVDLEDDYTGYYLLAAVIILIMIIIIAIVLHHKKKALKKKKRKKKSRKHLS